jgi:hypothetical protein
MPGYGGPSGNQQATQAVRNKNHWTRHIDHGFIQPGQPISSQRPNPVILFNQRMAVSAHPMHLPMLVTAALPAWQDQHCRRGLCHGTIWADAG